MTAYPQSRPNISRRVLVLGGAAAFGYVVLDGLCKGLAVGDITIDTSESHAETKHGVAEAAIVLKAMLAVAARNPIWFNRDPCQDGRWRYTLGLDDGRYAVWVLEKTLNPLVRKEKTRFITNDRDYIKAVNDKCGNQNWLGHLYAG